MTSLYKQSVPLYVKYLKALSHLLTKGEAFVVEKAKKPEELITYRLISDMRSLEYQVQSCCNTAVFFVDRVAPLEHKVEPDDEKTFEELQARVKKTIEYLETVDPKVIDDKIDQPFIMETKMGNFKFETCQTYLAEYAMPNFHFHLTSAYCLLRTQGVPVSAFDYLKDVFVKA